MLEKLGAIDLASFIYLNSFHHPSLDGVMSLLSGQLIWLPMVAYFLWSSYRLAGWKGLGFFVLFLALTLIASDITSSYLLKNITERLRPCRVESLKPFIHFYGQKCGGKYGFVSSHSANSLALILFSIRALRLRGWHYAFWLLPALVGYSRIYNGVHYPGDVLGGFVVGTCWALIFCWIYRQLREPDGTSAIR